MMRKYETIIILQPDLGEDDIKIVTGKIQDVVTSYKGELSRLDDWGIRKLAYSIRKCARGRYYYVRYDGDAALIAELERRLRLDEKVLRYQSINITDEPEKVVPEKKAPATESELDEAAEVEEAPVETATE
ncbi:MAG: 30S ribosomal protein S6 [Desulfuromonadales bacterium]|nr:30S ribosomal protein S6 [Desulfuromonadales bacterium]